MNKHLENTELYFRSVLYREEALMPAADFKALDKYVLGELKQDIRIITSAVKQNSAVYIKPLETKQVVFQAADLPQEKQREAIAVLLAKFPYLSPKLFTNILDNPNSYIDLEYTKYPGRVYKVCISLVRLTETIAEKQQEEIKEEKLAEKRKDEKKYSPSSTVRRLRAKPLKLLRDYHILELVEKQNF